MLLHNGPLTSNGFHLLLLLFMHMDRIHPSVVEVASLEIILSLDIIMLLL